MHAQTMNNLQADWPKEKAREEISAHDNILKLRSRVCVVCDERRFLLPEGTNDPKRRDDRASQRTTTSSATNAL
ncbi:hypothetical protein Q1695_008531 [Nippostrongylus brasiliensis]|nr:hypothetical protein Q1695_008531 [Nippostrongylus brasiliensis]